MKGGRKHKTKASSLGDCKRSTTFTCGKHTDCQSDPDNECRGECICDTDGFNKCKCVANGAIAGLAEEKEVANVDTGSILDEEKTIEKTLTGTHALKPRRVIISSYCWFY